MTRFVPPEEALQWQQQLHAVSKDSTVDVNDSSPTDVESVLKSEDAGLPDIEGRILKVDVVPEAGSSTSTLSIFHRDDHLELCIASNDGDPQSFDFDLLKDSLIPAYKQAPVLPLENCLILLRRGHNPQVLRFPGLTQTLDVQRALTGYRVLTDRPFASFSINGPSSPNKRGSLQLWQYKPSGTSNMHVSSPYERQNPDYAHRPLSPALVLFTYMAGKPVCLLTERKLQQSTISFTN